MHVSGFESGFIELKEEKYELNNYNESYIFSFGIVDSESILENGHFEKRVFQKGSNANITVNSDTQVGVNMVDVE